MPLIPSDRRLVTSDAAGNLPPAVLDKIPSPDNLDEVPDSATRLALTTAQRDKLAGIADGAEVNINPDWNAASGDAQILNKPTLGTAAAAAAADFATAAQGAKADSAVQPAGLVAAAIADATSVGRGVITAANAAAARTATGSEAAITAGTTAQYFRGDKTWQNLPQIPVAPTGTPAGDVTALTNALNTSSTTGGVVQPRGAFTINAQIPVPSGAKIDGSGATITQTANLTRTFYVSAATNVRIMNVTAYGKTTDRENTSAIANASAVMIQTGSTNVQVVGCTFLGFAGSGVWASADSSDILVDRCFMTGPGALAQEDNLGAGFTGMDGTSSWAVTNCTISGFAQGITCGDGSRVRISGNVIRDISGQHGIYVHAISDLQVLNNQVYNTRLQGIKIQISKEISTGCRDVIVANNLFKNNGIHNIHCNNITITTEVVNRLKVVNNICMTSAQGDGLNIQNVKNADLSGNIIEGTGRGIRVETGSDVRIRNNDISNTGYDGIRIALTSNYQVIGNNITNPGGLNDANGRFGIFATNGATGGRLRGNTIVDDRGTALMQFGIYVTSGQASTDVIDNEVTGATGYGYRGEGAAVAARTFRGNSFQGVTGPIQTPPTNFVTNPDTSGAALAVLETEINELKATLRAAGLIRA